MQFRVIVVTDPPTQKHTHRQDRLQYTAPQLAHSVMTETLLCSLAGFCAIVCRRQMGLRPRGTTGCTPPISFVFHAEQRGTGAKWRCKNFFCGRMDFLLPASRIHSLDLIHSLTTKTHRQGKGVTPLTLALCQYPTISGAHSVSISNLP